MNGSVRHFVTPDRSDPSAGTWRWAFLLPVLFAVGLVSPASAQDGGSDWKIVVSPYIWTAGLSGSVAPSAVAPTVDVDASFSDILEELDFGAMVAGSATRGNIGFYGDLQYYQLRSGDVTPGPLFGGAVLETELWVITLGGEYVVLDTPESQLSLTAGARYWDVSMDLDISAGALPGISASAGDNWVDGLIGVRGRTQLGDRWFGLGWAAVGAGGADFTSDVFAGVGYEISDRTSVVGGYRYLSVDRTNDTGFVYDIEQQGLLLGLRFEF